MTERVNIERINSSVSNPIFVAKENFDGGEQSRRETVRVGDMDVVAQVRDIGSFRLKSITAGSVAGFYNREGGYI